MKRSGSSQFPAMLAASMLVFSLAQAQTDSEAQPDAPQQQPASEPLADPTVGLNDESIDGEADAAAAPEPVQATLERFVPSEQISEDNSVAYPNDI